MGKQLESMTKHYGQMEDAVREREAGVILGEEDLAGMYLNVGFSTCSRVSDVGSST